MTIPPGIPHEAEVRSSIPPCLLSHLFDLLAAEFFFKLDLSNLFSVDFLLEDLLSDSTVLFLVVVLGNVPFCCF